MRDRGDETHLDPRQTTHAVANDDPDRDTDDQQQQQTKTDREIAPGHLLDERTERTASTVADDELPVGVMRGVADERQPRRAHRNGRRARPGLTVKDADGRARRAIDRSAKEIHAPVGVERIRPRKRRVR